MHIYILGPKLLQWNFLQISQMSIRSGAHKLFLPIFGLFAIFDRNFSKIVATPNDVNENYAVHLKEQSLLIYNPFIIGCYSLLVYFINVVLNYSMYG